MDSAACIGCGACVAACKNASAHLFVGAKISHLALLPQGQVERERRVTAMIAQAAREVPLQRLGRPEEVAWAVIFLASDRADFITGETLYVSGGPRVSNRED